MVEFQVLRCADCQMFQVLQVTKSQKWKCKLCGSKQSVIKVYGRGTGADCRKHVQKLNSLRGEIDMLKEEASFFPATSAISEVPLGGLSTQDAETSRWSKFVEDEVEETKSKDELKSDGNASWVTTDRVLFDKERKQGKINKRKRGFGEDYGPQSSSIFGKKYNYNAEARKWGEYSSHFDHTSVSSKVNNIPTVYTSNFHVKDEPYSQNSLQMLNNRDSNIIPASSTSETIPKSTGMKQFSDRAAVSSKVDVSDNVENEDLNRCQHSSLPHWNKSTKANGENKSCHGFTKPQSKKVANFSSTTSTSKWNSFLDFNQSEDYADSDEESDLTLSESGQLTVFLPVATGYDLTKS